MTLRSSSALQTPSSLVAQPSHLRLRGRLREAGAPAVSSRPDAERDPAFLVFTVEAGPAAWTVHGPASAPRRVISPLADERFRWLVASLREWAGRPVPLGRPDPLRTAAFAEDRARRVSARLTRALLTEEDQRALALAMAANGQAELAIRVRSLEGEAGDEVLALPWELLAPEQPGRFPVRDGRLTILREAVGEGASACNLGYFGPGDAELGARLVARFHAVLAAGRTIPEAAGAARALLGEPLGEKGARHHFPFGWSQLAVYQRGDAASWTSCHKTVRIG